MDCSLKNNVDEVVARVREAQSRRAKEYDTGDVTIVGASKTVPPELLERTVELGIKDLGENRVQEFTAKCDIVQGAVWHFIGTLQRNKAKYLVGKVALIQSVTSVELAEQIDALAAKRGIVCDVLAEVNISGEPSKTGAAAADIPAIVERIKGLRHVNFRGLMAVPAIGADDGVYERAYELFRFVGGDILSIGMSGDYEKAIKYGSNMVRIGTALFGRRTIGG